MRTLIVGVMMLGCTNALAQTSLEQPLIDKLNKSIGATDTTVPNRLADKGPKTLESLPNWGVVVKSVGGKVIDVFGQVGYEINTAGKVEIPGYNTPAGTSLEVVPQKEWLTAAKTAASSDLDPMFRPITVVPDAVKKATNFLANELCATKGRPTGMTLSLVVSASGSLFFASVGTEAGSEVNWDFQEMCTRNGLEGNGIAFK